MTDTTIAAVFAKATLISAAVIGAAVSLLGQISNSAATASGAAVLSGLMLSTFALVRFLVVRSTTDEGRSSEMWDDLRSERDAARARVVECAATLETVRHEREFATLQKAKWQAIAGQLRSEFRARVGEEPTSWPTNLTE